MSGDNEHMPFKEDIMRLLSLRSIPVVFILLAGCGKHDLRCDAHLTPINSPEPLAAPADLKPSQRGSP